jgi:hypothetical protein
VGLFSRAGGADMRDRDYVLTGCPVIAQDDVLVIIDLTVRLTVRPPRDDERDALGYDSADERAVHAVCVLVLRQLGTDISSDELLVGRGRIVEAVEQALRLAPTGAGVDAKVSTVEVWPYDEREASFRHEFRLAAGA